MKHPRMDYKEAAGIAQFIYEKLPPKASRPDWFDDCATLSGSRDREGRWLMSVTLAENEPLEDGEYWEELGGHWSIISPDKVTGEKRVVISRCGGPVLTVFEVLIDPRDESVDVRVDRDLSDLDGALYKYGPPDG